MRKISAVFLTLVMLLTMISPAMAAESALQHNYSSATNSGIRHEVCTTLAGTNVNTYYTDDYTIGRLFMQTGNTLLQNLRTLMTSTHTHYTTYGDCRDYATKTDCENGDGKTINLLYSSYISNRGEYINDTSKGWNREHVWPVSLGSFSKEQTPGCDLHHIRPTDSSLNSTRGNDKYGVVTGGREITGTVVTGGALGGKKGGGFMEPLDNAKGDVARICLYMYVRYGSEYSGCKSITNVFQSIDVLLEWCALDPVDTWEMGRNEVVYAIQGNRNVFIDYPELAWSLFSKEIPKDLVTPSGNTNIQTVCSHKNVEHRNTVEPSCTVIGYSGDVHCADCGKFLSEGTESPATGVHAFGNWTAVEGASNLYSRSCNECGFEEARTILAAKPGISVTWIPIAIAVACVAAVGVAVILIKKKK